MSEIQKGALLVLGLDDSDAKIPILVDTDGKILAAIHGETDAGNNTPLLVTTDGIMQAVLQGEYEGTNTAVQVDANGRLLADLNILDYSMLDFDSFAQGCDHRVSLSTANNLDWICYLINTYNSLYVIRYINAMGSASLGTYMISIGGPDTLVGTTGVNEVTLDHHLYKKTLENHDFSITETNCTLNGLVIDVRRYVYANERMTAVSSPGFENALEEDWSYDEDHEDNNGSTVYLREMSFDSTNIDVVNGFFHLFTPDAPNSGTFYLQLKIDDVWTTIDTQTIDETESNADYYTIHDTTGYSLVSGIRIGIDTGVYEMYCRTYNITFKETES